MGSKLLNPSFCEILFALYNRQSTSFPKVAGIFFNTPVSNGD